MLFVETNICDEETVSNPNWDFKKSLVIKKISQGKSAPIQITFYSSSFVSNLIC